MQTCWFLTSFSVVYSPGGMITSWRYRDFIRREPISPRLAIFTGCKLYHSSINSPLFKSFKSIVVCTTKKKEERKGFQEGILSFSLTKVKKKCAFTKNNEKYSLKILTNIYKNQGMEKEELIYL